jgi:hypothetical protein
MMLVDILQFLAALSAVITVWIYGNKNNNAPIYGMISNVIWISWSYVSANYFMLFMSFFFTFIHIRNYVHMRN